MEMTARAVRRAVATSRRWGDVHRGRRGVGLGVLVGKGGVALGRRRPRGPAAGGGATRGVEGGPPASGRGSIRGERGQLDPLARGVCDERRGRPGQSPPRPEGTLQADRGEARRDRHVASCRDDAGRRGGTSRSVDRHRAPGPGGRTAPWPRAHARANAPPATGTDWVDQPRSRSRLRGNLSAARRGDDHRAADRGDGTARRSEPGVRRTRRTAIGCCCRWCSPACSTIACPTSTRSPRWAAVIG